MKFLRDDNYGTVHLVSSPDPTLEVGKGLSGELGLNAVFPSSRVGSGDETIVHRAHDRIREKV